MQSQGSSEPKPLPVRARRPSAPTKPLFVSPSAKTLLAPQRRSRQDDVMACLEQIVPFAWRVEDDRVLMEAATKAAERDRKDPSTFTKVLAAVMKWLSQE
jgi:hypothetical protein